MSIRTLMSTAAGLALATGAGLTNSLHAQNAAADFKADNAFVAQVAGSNLMEVRLGQAVRSKVQTPRVQQYAAKMVNDHSTAQQQWMAVAKKHGASFNARLSSEQEQTLNRLRALSGRELEVAYMDQMVQDHQNNLNTFTTQGRSARSADTRELGERGILMLGEHLRLANQIRGELNTNVAANPNAPAQQPGAQPTTPWGDVKPEVKPAPGSQQPGSQQPGQPAPQSQSSQANQGSAQISDVTAQTKADVKADAEFIKDIAADHSLEQDLAKLASKKAQNPQVKQYAERVLNDHKEMQQLWLAVANKNDMKLTSGYGKNHKSKLTKLQKRSGASFDREYMTMEIRNHKDYLDYFNREGQSAHAADVRELVNRHTPALQSHFNLAKQIGARVGADTNVELRATSLLR